MKEQMSSRHFPKHVAASATAGQRLRYYDFIMAAFVAILLLSNIIGAAKRSEIDLPLIGTWSFGAGIMFFPLSYIIGDVLTEVYGYARARRVIWAGFAALIFMAFMSFVVVSLPPAQGWNDQSAYEAVFGNSWRIVIASIAAFWAGEFANSVVMAKMKLLTEGRFLWMRTIGSTIVGQGLDSLIFYPLAFYGLAGWPLDQLVQVVVSQFILKTCWEALLTPVTYLVVGTLKQREGLDIYDEGTDFTPFRTRV
ncbi:MAG: VUT family protein [Sphingomonadales bacterium]|nr:MAG: VUT family protein [Sphingomonadales bacterium]TNF03952.1 MAG: VUT family protein [Sphingomonadales bacterium]